MSHETPSEKLQEIVDALKDNRVTAAERDKIRGLCIDLAITFAVHEDEAAPATPIGGPSVADLLRHRQSASAAHRGKIKDRYDAIRDEALGLGHEMADVNGDPPGMGERVSTRVGGFLPDLRAAASERVTGWNAEMDPLAATYAIAVAEARAIGSELARFDPPVP